MDDLDCANARVLIAGALDGEIDAPEAESLRLHLAGCEACRHEEALQRAGARALRQSASRHVATPQLAARIRTALKDDDVAVPVPAARRPPWYWIVGWFGAGLATASMLLMVSGLLVARPGGPESGMLDEVVSEHVRAMMRERTIDVVSTDRHTVKPWFAGKIDFAPPVPDLTASGFVLAGGRLDYIDHRPVAALVYRRRQHVIDVFVIPERADHPAGPNGSALRGYNVVGWNDEGLRFVAVSDLAQEELALLPGLFLAARPGAMPAAR